jgi:excisionase family DNA binding protein
MQLLFSIPETCRLLSIGRTTAYQLLKSGLLQKKKIGRRTLITRDSVLALAGLSEKEGNGC